MAATISYDDPHLFVRVDRVSAVKIGERRKNKVYVWLLGVQEPIELNCPDEAIAILNYNQYKDAVEALGEGYISSKCERRKEDRDVE